MQSRAIATVMIFAITYLLSPQAIAAGRTASNSVNTILNGKGAPKSSLGIDGDFYIDTRSLLLYGPKRSGKWPAPQSMQGPTGPSGSAGKNGSDGKTVASNVSASNGVQGAVGPQGEKGEKGEKGDTGLPGATGAAGPAGAMGLPGPAGATGAAGVNGLNGSTGAQGTAGSAGIAGAKGETGTVGPSEVTVIDIPNWTLSSATQFSFAASNAFGELQTGSNYKFDVFLYGTSTLANLVLGADVVCSNATVSWSYIHSDTRYTNYNSTKFKYSFLLTGTVSEIQIQTGLVLRIIDAYGETGAGALTLTGKAYITLVGAIR